MGTTALVLRGLAYYWRSNVAVVLGVATAVAVLAGALLVGDSVRGSLRDLFTERLGKTDEIIGSITFFREQLADEIQADTRFAESFSAACPLIVISGVVADQNTGRRAAGVQVYGVDDRFWKFHDLEAKVRTPADRDVLLSPGLARELGSQPGSTVLLRIEKPTAIPAGSLLGRKDDLGRTIRLVFREVLPASNLGEFSVKPGQGEVRAIFVSLSRLQKELEKPRSVNLILVRENESRAANQPDRAATMREILSQDSGLEDLGVKLRVLDEGRGISLESERGIVSDQLYADARTAAANAGLRLQPILSYLANSIRAGQREVPYSIVTGLSPESFDAVRQGSSVHEQTGSSDEQRDARQPPDTQTAKASRIDADHQQHTVAQTGTGGEGVSSAPPLLLNDWAAENLQARPGEPVTLEYYIWEDQGVLSTHYAEFRLAGIVPMKGEAADRDLVPDYPGITTTQNISDWDPPFPVELQRVRPIDEAYWHQYRTTPKAFIPLETARQLWRSRYGELTSIRIRSTPGADPGSYLGTFSQALRAAMNPGENGLSVTPARIEGTEASRGATDFGEYFVYFSFFLVIAALLLASLFFKLGVEQRLREIGTLRALGFPVPVVRKLFLREGAVLAITGSALGIIGAVGYGALLMYGLRTWWVGAVGTAALRLHVSAASLLLGAAGGTVVAVLCIVWTLRKLVQASPRSLLTGSLDAVASESAGRRNGRRSGREGKGVGAAGYGRKRGHALAIIFGVAGLALLLFASLNVIGKTSGFFGAGAMLLLASLSLEHTWLTATRRRPVRGRGRSAVLRLGFRNASYRAGRSILCIALIAFAAFIIVAVESFKRAGGESVDNRKSGSGGFRLLAESQLPLYHDPNTADGREALGLFAQKGFDPEGVVFSSFRVRPGDDASCLNLYQPREPRILAPSDDFLRSGRFSFQESAAGTKEERENPWLLLTSTLPDGAIPVIADANSMTYVLHRKLGDDILFNQASGGPARLRLVAALSDSIFQGELLMSDDNFLRLFPDRGGYSFFLIDPGTEAASAASGALAVQLADFGFEPILTSERLGAFHRVENTYLSTFEALGGLGLVLGTLGLAAVLLRNVLERRRELALLRAVGYNSAHFALMVIAENFVLVCCGLLTGALSALVAIGPAFASRGGHLPAVSLWMMFAVLATGLFASLGATLAALRMPLLASLRAE